jgi:L-glyceraldehyde 3-phosphate reductase
VQQGKALYAGISSYSAKKTVEAAGILWEMGVPLLIHQPSYSMFNRWIEPKLLDVLGKEGIGCIVFSPLAQGMLTGRYLDGIPDDSRAGRGVGSLKPEFLNEDNLDRIRSLNRIAEKRGQSLSQMAVSWCLRDPRVTTVLIGASRPEQITENVAALKKLEFSKEELSEIDEYAVEGGINIWAKSSQAG